jgi:hypothetical protein
MCRSSSSSWNGAGCPPSDSRRHSAAPQSREIARRHRRVIRRAGRRRFANGRRSAPLSGSVASRQAARITQELTEHSVIRQAVSSAAGSLEAQLSAHGVDAVREEHFREALQLALEDAGEVCAQDVRPELPGWPDVEGGKLGGFDLAVTARDGDAYRYLAELKWCYVDKLWETLWDAFKISLASGLDGAEAAYVIAGASASLWEKPAACAELFAGGVCSTRELISRYSTNWSWLLGESSTSQPVRLPELIQTELVANEPLQLSDAVWVIKAISITPATGETIEFENGWPADRLADLNALPPDQAEAIRHLKAAISTPVPEDVIVWRYFDSPTLHQNAERLLGAELRDLGFVDVTLARDVALQHIPTAHPVLAKILLREGALVAPTMLINKSSQDADLLLAPGTRFRVAQVGREDGLLTVLLEIVD